MVKKPQNVVKISGF